MPRNKPTIEVTTRTEPITLVTRKEKGMKTRTIPGLMSAAKKVEPGIYTFRVDACDEKATAKGDPMWLFRVVIADEDNEFFGRALFVTIVLDTEYTARTIATFASACGVEIDGDEFDPDSLIDCFFKAEVYHDVNKETGEPVERLRRFMRA